MAAEDSSGDASGGSRTLTDLPLSTLRAVVRSPVLDASARLALLRVNTALSAVQMLHTSSRKHITLHVPDSADEPWWTPALLRLLNHTWGLPEAAALDLHMRPLAAAAPPRPYPALLRPPPADLSRRVAHLRLHHLALQLPADLDPSAWPNLETLSIDWCRLNADDANDGTSEGPGAVEVGPLPQLRRLSLRHATVRVRPAALEALLALASGPHVTEVEWMVGEGQEEGLRQDMPPPDDDARQVITLSKRLVHLTRLDSSAAVMGEDLLELLSLCPRLQHLSVGKPSLVRDLDRKACPLKTFTVSCCDFRSLLALPLAPPSTRAGTSPLEKFVVKGSLGAKADFMRAGGERGAASLALMTRLHSNRQLLVAPGDHVPRKVRQMFGLQRTDKLLQICLAGPQELQASLLQLVAEVAPDVEVLRIDAIPLSGTRLSAFRPALARFPSLHTLCFYPGSGPFTAPDFWIDGLAALPANITRVHLRVQEVLLSHAAEMVRDGALPDHPLTLMLQGAMTDCDKQELQAAAEGRRGGLLTVVVRADEIVIKEDEEGLSDPDELSDEEEDDEDEGEEEEVE